MFIKVATYSFCRKVIYHDEKLKYWILQLFCQTGTRFLINLNVPTFHDIVNTLWKVCPTTYFYFECLKCYQSEWLVSESICVLFSLLYEAVRQEITVSHRARSSIAVSGTPVAAEWSPRAQSLQVFFGLPLGRWLVASTSFILHKGSLTSLPYI